MRERVPADLLRGGIPVFRTDSPDLDRAWNLAVDDMLYNVGLFKDGLLKEKVPVLLAGGGYDTPWTRDAAINTWNAAGLLLPEVAKNTLLSVLTEDGYGRRIGGQYWDAVIWTTGAYRYWLYTGDDAFLPLIRECTVNSLAYFEDTEWDEKMGLFRGPACYGDGIAAYPDRYVTVGGGILAWPEHVPPEERAPKGYGIPLFTVSTNCLYAECYRLAHVMTGDARYAEKHEALKARINEVFWDEKKGIYDYAVDAKGREDRQEALGQSFAILFDIADDEKKARILENCVVSENGICCLYPTYERYLPYGIGRHSGTVWPFAQAFFADAAVSLRPDRSAFELETLTRNALRSGQFYEIYHPQTGEPYGGAQETDGPMKPDWASVPHQTWSATGYLRMRLFDLAGLHISEDGIHIHPARIADIQTLTLEGLRYRGAVIDLTVTPGGWDKEAFVPADAAGKVSITL